MHVSVSAAPGAGGAALDDFESPQFDTESLVGGVAVSASQLQAMQTGDYVLHGNDPKYFPRSFLHLATDHTGSWMWSSRSMT